MGKKVTATILIGGNPDKKLLEKCLKSVSWCDEIIKVEGKTGGFSEWRNAGFKKANRDWILYVDSDEEVSSALRAEIVSSIRYPVSGVVAYAIPRRNFIFNKEFKHGGLWPDYVKRLFQRSKFRGWKGELHEEPIYEGEMGHLKNPLIHHKDISISQMVEKTNEWSEIEAKLMFEAGHPRMNIFRFFTAAFREFWLRMIEQMAFLDGKEGVIYAVYQVYSRLISYAKLWEKQRS